MSSWRTNYKTFNNAFAQFNYMTLRGGELLISITPRNDEKEQNSALCIFLNLFFNIKKAYKFVKIKLVFLTIHPILFVDISTVCRTKKIFLLLFFALSKHHHSPFCRKKNVEQDRQDVFEIYRLILIHCTFSVLIQLLFEYSDCCKK